jgi:hypothetical protein
MTAPMSEEPGDPAGAQVRPVDRREIVRRANQLCRRAEPHADEVPCQAHLQEAQRQLLGMAV